MAAKTPKKALNEWILLVIAVGLLVSGIVLSFQDKTASATATYGTAILCLIFSSLSMFQSFKGLGVEGVLRDKIEEADRLITHLQSFILPTSKLLISNIARSGRWDSGLPRNEKYSLFNQLIDNMRAVNLSQADIEIAKKDWYRFNLFDLSSPIFKDVEILINPLVDELQQQMRAISQPISAENRVEHESLIQSINEINQWKKSFHDLRQKENLFSLHQEIRQHFNDCPFIKSEKKEEFLTTHRDVLEDLDFYSNEKEFRRLEVWLSNK
jgi:hypothetical protein